MNPSISKKYLLARTAMVAVAVACFLNTLSPLPAQVDHSIGAPQADGADFQQPAPQQPVQPQSAMQYPVYAQLGYQPTAYQQPIYQQQVYQQQARDYTATPGAQPFLNPGSQSPDYGELPQPGARYVIPPSGQAPGNVRIEVENGLVTLVARNALLRDVLSLLADRQQINIVMMVDGNATINLTLNQVPLQDALTSILAIAGYTWTVHNQIVHVTSIASTQVLTPHVQGRQVRVFELDYLSAIDLDGPIQGMLSPAGRSQPIVSSPLDNRRTTESIIVEDYPQFLERIEQYVLQVDIPPRQVLIQVHVLQIDLNNNQRHGINFENLLDWGGADIRINTIGLANSLSSPAFFASIDSTDVNALVEMLASNTSSHTLAAPQILALNGQESRLQVGEQLGYRTTTTTETSTQENINFLDVGVVLSVTPRISRDQHVLLHLKPEVSSGEVNDTTGLPRESTSEVETNVLLANGQAVIIGGLIQKNDTYGESKIPGLGNIPVLRHFFRRQSTSSDRSEIVFILSPYVVEQDCDPAVTVPNPDVWKTQSRFVASAEPEQLNQPVQHEHSSGSKIRPGTVTPRQTAHRAPAANPLRTQSTPRTILGGRTQVPYASPGNQRSANRNTQYATQRPHRVSGMANGQPRQAQQRPHGEQAGRRQSIAQNSGWTGDPSASRDRQYTPQFRQVAYSESRPQPAMESNSPEQADAIPASMQNPDRRQRQRQKYQLQQRQLQQQQRSQQHRQ